MSTPQEKPRRWFQIHLSTGIVLMFVAGGLMWLNNVPGMFAPYTVQVTLGRPHIGVTHEHLPQIGWPWLIHDQHYLIADSSTGPTYSYNLKDETFYYLADLAVATALFFTITFLLEWRIRRAKNPTQA